MVAYTHKGTLNTVRDKIKCTLQNICFIRNSYSMNRGQIRVY